MRWLAAQQGRRRDGRHASDAALRQNGRSSSSSGTIALGLIFPMTRSCVDGVVVWSGPKLARAIERAVTRGPPVSGWAQADVAVLVA